MYVLILEIGARVDLEALRQTRTHRVVQRVHGCRLEQSHAFTDDLGRHSKLHRHELGELACHQLELAEHPKKLIVLDMKPERAALALRMGADEVWNPAEVDVLAKIREITEGYGCDIYIEATGHHKAVNQGLAMLRKLGRFVEFSVFNDEATVDWSIIGDRKELDILGSHLGPYMYPRAIDFIGNRKIDMRDVVTHKFALADFKEAFAVMERGDKSLKVVLEP